MGYDSTGPRITFGWVNSRKNFRGEVHQRTYFFPILKVLLFVRNWQSEIDNFDGDLIGMRVLIYLLTENNVLWFEIPMNNTHLVDVVDRCDNLSQNFFLEVLRKVAAVYAWFESSSFAVIKYKIQGLLIFESFVHFDDVWMVQFSKNIYLPPNHHPMVDKVDFFDDFDSSFSFSGKLNTSIDSSKGSSPYSFFDVVFLQKVFSLEGDEVSFFQIDCGLEWAKQLF